MQDLPLLLHALENATPTKFVIPRENILDEISIDIARYQEEEEQEILQMPLDDNTALGDPEAHRRSGQCGMDSVK